MSAIRKAPIQLTILTLFLLAVVLVLAFRYTARAQDNGTPTLSDQDIGVAFSSGGAQAGENGGYTITSAGTNISGQADSFNYLYESLGTNGQIVAQLLGIETSGGIAEAGLMIRESLDADSRNAAILASGSGTCLFQSRLETNATTRQTLGSTNVSIPCWIKLVRSGDWIGGYTSVDGTNWVLVDWRMISDLAPEAYVGLAVTAGNNQRSSASAQFGQVGVGTADMSQITLPAIGSGDGLAGSYFDNRHLFGQAVTNHIAKQLNFNFYGMLSNCTCPEDLAVQCQALLGVPRRHEFGVRWVGEVQAQFSEPYTLYVENDGGVRVWLNGQLLINQWQDHPVHESSATVNLTAGQRYLLRVDYFENLGQSQIRLDWSSPSTSRRMIPQTQFYSQPTMDANGLPIYWEEHYFGQTNVDPNADPDHDGLSNEQEWCQGTDPTNPTTQGVPDTWGHGDIGPSFTVGDAGCSNGVFTLESSGSDIWGRSDSFHYAYQALGTNGQLIAHISGVGGGNFNSKAGIMLREALNQNARYMMVLLTESNLISCQWRQTIGGARQRGHAANEASPYWFKLVRNEDWVGAYTSADGTNWTLFDWTTLEGLAPEVFVGLAVSGHGGPDGADTPAVARFDQVSIVATNLPSPMNVPEGTGDGLSGSYRNDSLLYLPGLTNRVDSQIDYTWYHGTPFNNTLNPNSYGVVWSGEVQAQFTEPYTFSIVTRQEDWARVWINEQLVIDQWRTLHTNGDFKGIPVNLVAGQHYLIRVEMYNDDGNGVAVLNWSSPSTSERLIPQSQLYSQPQMDSDGSGLPVIWEQIYFGQTGVDPNADPDDDGLSNLQEWKYHTNPTNSDTDGDGLPDSWEIAHGLDPQYPDDAGIDYNNSGLSNLQDYLMGLNPFNADVNGDGLPDWFEEEYLGTGSSLACTNQISVALALNGSQAINYLGNWQVDGSDIYCMDRRGGVDFDLSITNADKYVLNLSGTQNQRNSLETSFSLLLGIDNQSLEHYTLNAGYGTNGTVELVLPYLQTGMHVLHVFWDGYASYSNLRIKQVKLLSVSGQTNSAGIKAWAAQMISDESGIGNTNAVIGSYASPVCVEGQDSFPTMATMTDSQTNALSPVATSDQRWYVNVPLNASNETLFQASFQNGALVQTANLQWVAVNLLNATNLTIRKGDSLLFNALPTNGVNGQLQVVIGTNTYSGNTTHPASYRFISAGNYSVTGTYRSPSGQTQSGSITVAVVEQRLPVVNPCAWVGMSRVLVLTNLVPETVLQADSRLTCYVAGTNAGGGVQLALGIDANEPRTILARLGTNGPILDSTQVQGFDVWSGDQAYTKIVQVYPDGSQLVEMLMISSPVETNVVFELQPIVSGVTFDDGTMLKTLTSTNFDGLGQYPVRFIRPASVTTSVCNQIKGYQGMYQVGYRH